MAPATFGACAVCLAPATQCCSSCRTTFYCNRDHQRQHWKVHKTECMVFRVEFDEVLGRYLVATRDIRQGEVILQEEPLVVGPKVASHPTCLGCLKRVSPSEGGAYSECSDCGWPVCGPCCKTLALHVGECALMKARGHRRSISCPERDVYCIITPLRCLLLKDSALDKYNKLMSLQSHLEQRSHTSLYNMFKTNLVSFIRNVLGMDEFSPETILQVAAILDTNAFEIRRKCGEIDARGVYPLASLLSHDCRPNTKHTFVGPKFKLVLVATVPIAKDCIISTTYTNILCGTLTRRANLKTTRCFDCACARCCDATEFGTYLGSISCAACKSRSGSEDSRMVSTNPLDASAVWKCNKCSHTIPGRQMAWGNDAMRQELDAVRKASVNKMEEFLHKYEGALHPSNCHVVQLKYALLLAYGNAQGYQLPDLSDEHLERKLDLCHEVLEVVDVLDPGMSQMRGMLLYEMQAAMVVQAKSDFENDRITKANAQEVTNEAMALLQSAADILRSDPDMEAQLHEKLTALSESLEQVG